MSNSQSRLPYIVLGFTSLLVALNLFFKLAPSVLSMDFMQDFGVSGTSLAAFSGATMLGFALMQLPSGIITDFFGGRKTLSILFFIAGISVLVFSVTASPTVAIISRFTLGIGIAVTVPGLTLLAQWFTGRSFIKANSIFLTCGALGSLLATGPLAYAAAAFGWRNVLFAMGIFALVLVALLWKCVPPFPPSLCALEKKPISIAAVKGNVKQVGRRRIYWILALWMGCIPGMAMAFMAMWWGPYLMQGCGMSQTEAGSVLGTIFFLALPMIPVIAWIYSSVIPDKRILLALLSLLSLIAAGGFMLLCGNNSKPLHIMVGTLFQYVTSGGITILYASMRELFPLRIAGTALGCLNTMLPLSGMLIQHLFGFLLERGEAAFPGDMRATYLVPLSAFMVLAFLGLIASFFIRPEETMDAEDALEEECLG